MFSRKRFKKFSSSPVDVGRRPESDAAEPGVAMFPRPVFIRPLEGHLTARDEDAPFPTGRRREMHMSDYGISRSRLVARRPPSTSTLRRHCVSPSTASTTSTASTLWRSDLAPESPSKPLTLGSPGLSEFFDVSDQTLMELADDDDWIPLDAPDELDARWHPEGAWEAARIARCHGISSIIIVAAATSDAGGTKPHLLGCHGLLQNATPHWLSRELLLASRKQATWLPLEDGLSPGAASRGKVRCFGAKLVAVTCVASDHGVVDDLFFQQDLETLLELVSYCRDGGGA